MLPAGKHKHVDPQVLRQARTFAKYATTVYGASFITWLEGGCAHFLCLYLMHPLCKVPSPAAQKGPRDWSRLESFCRALPGWMPGCLRARRLAACPRPSASRRRLTLRVSKYNNRALDAGKGRDPAASFRGGCCPVAPLPSWCSPQDTLIHRPDARSNKWYSQAKLLLRRGLNAYKQNELNAEKITTLKVGFMCEGMLCVMLCGSYASHPITLLCVLSVDLPSCRATGPSQL